MNYRLFVLVLGTFIIGTDDFVIAGLLPSISNDLDITIAAAGQLVTAFAIAYAIGAPVLGVLTLNMPIKTLLVLSMIAFTIANGLSAVMVSFEWLFATRVLAALAAALFTPLAMTAATSIVSDNMRGKALSFVIAGITIGLIFGAPIGTWIGNAFIWRYSFAFVALISLVTVIAVLILLPRVERGVHVNIKEGLKGFNKMIIMTLTVSIIATTGGFMSYTYIAPMITEITSVENISVFLFILGIGALFGNLLGGYLTDRIGAPKTLKWSLFGFAVALVAFPLFSLLEPSTLTIVLVGVFSLLWGIPGFGMNPAANAFLISLNPKQASMVLSFSASALYLGIGLGASVGGAVIHFTSVSYVGFASGIFVCIALIIFIFVDRLVHKKQEV
ncbi:MFS transporter [Bacillus sp. FSL W7-1360]